MIALFCDGSSFWPIFGLLAGASVPLERLGQFAVSMVHQRKKHVEGTGVSYSHHCDFVFGQSKRCFVQKQITRKKEDLRNPLCSGSVYPFEAHSEIKWPCAEPSCWHQGRRFCSQQCLWWIKTFLFFSFLLLPFIIRQFFIRRNV